MLGAKRQSYIRQVRQRVHPRATARQLSEEDQALVQMVQQPVETVAAMDRPALAEVEDLEVHPVATSAMAAAMAALAAQEAQDSLEDCPRLGHPCPHQQDPGGQTPDSWRSHLALMARLRSGASGD